MYDRVRAFDSLDFEFKIRPPGDVIVSGNLRPIDLNDQAYTAAELTATEDELFTYDFPMHVFVGDNEESNDFSFQVGGLPDWLEVRYLTGEPTSQNTMGVIRFQGYPENEDVTDAIVAHN